eukprot:3702635-Amphidinium_carterae.1
MPWQLKDRGYSEHERDEKTSSQKSADVESTPPYWEACKNIAKSCFAWGMNEQIPNITFV